MRSASALSRIEVPADATAFPVQLRAGERIFYRPADPNAILESLTEQDFRRDEQVPYWAEHWPSANVTARFLERIPFSPGSRICEIGCGLGVLTTVLSSQSDSVVGLDIAPAGCRYAAMNVALHEYSARIVCGDWRRPPFSGGFDAIVGVDVLYEQRWVETVLAFVKSMLCDNGVAIIADPCRQYWKQFQQRVRAEGLACAVAHRELSPSRRLTIEVLRIVA